MTFLPIFLCLVSISVSLEDIDCLALRSVLLLKATIGDAGVTVQRCKLNYDRQRLRSVRAFSFVSLSSLPSCVCTMISHKRLIAIIMKDRENRFIAVNTRVYLDA